MILYLFVPCVLCQTVNFLAFGLPVDVGQRRRVDLVEKNNNNNLLGAFLLCVVKFLVVLAF